MSTQRPEDLAETEQWEQLKRTTRAQGGPLMRDPPEHIIIPLTGPHRIMPDLHTAALDNLADAIRELAAALNRTLTPQDTPAEDGSPGPAKGLITQIRPNPDWRPRGAARRIVGFTHDQEESA